MSGQRGVLVFDMDGVLVDVTGSYRETIRRTVQHFTGTDVGPEAIQDYKNAGGYNNDWLLSHRMILDLGVEVEYSRVVDEFQALFFGRNGEDGLILRERWLPENGLLDRLRAGHLLSIFTGRLRDEVNITLARFTPQSPFELIVPDDEVPKPKPAPDGLLHIAALYPSAPMIYVGDSVDDARSSREAGVPFIGIADPKNSRYPELLALLKQQGARAVIGNINELESVL